MEAEVSGTRWCGVAVLVSGPEIDVSGGCAAFGDAAAVIDDLKVVEDGRLHMSVSGIALIDPSGQEEPVVLTCAAAFAPFFVRRSIPPSLEARDLNSSIDDALVPTTEIFVVFPGDDADNDDEMLGLAAAASLSACVPLEEAEGDFRRIQAGSKTSPASPAISATSDAPTSQHAVMASLLPSLGSLGIAVLRVPPSEKDPLPDGLGVPLHLGSLCEAMATLSYGCDIRIRSSPFGSLKPSLFMHTEVCGTVASSPSACSGLMLLDARCLPGSEGGVVVLSGPGSSAATSDVPVGLVVPSIRGPSGDRIALGAAVSLHAISRSLLQLLPRAALAAVFGPRLRGTLGVLAQTEHATHEFGPDDVEPALRSTCILTTLDGNHSTSALVLSATGHLLTSASFVSKCCSRGEPSTLRCRPSRGQSGGDCFEVSVLHVFDSVRGAALVHLSSNGRELGGRPLPWAISQGLELHQGCTDVWLLRLSEQDEAPRLIPGVLGKLVFEPETKAPTLLQCKTSVPQGDCVALLRAGPQAELLGLVLSGTGEESPDLVMRHSHLSLAASHLIPLLRPGGKDGVGQLRRLDVAWRERLARGSVAAMIWRLESGAGPSLRARAQPGSAKL